MANLLQSIGRILNPPAAQAGPTVPDTGPLTKQTVKQVESYLPIILSRLKTGQDFEKVAREIATHAGVAPDQVAKYVQATIRAGQPN